MARQIQIHEIEQFSLAQRVPNDAISPEVRDGVRNLHEKEALEPAIRELLYDPNDTPHGPTEIADILTSRVEVRGEPRVAAFVLKGRSFTRVGSRDVTHQFVRLRHVPDLGLMVFMAVGDIQDDARRDFGQIAQDAGCDYLIVDRHDIARLLIAYEKICPDDGTPFDEKGTCEHGHLRDPGIRLEYRVREDPRYEIPSLRDVSHPLAKRYSAVVLVDRHYPRPVLREIVRSAIQDVRASNYYRSELVENHWAETPAHVVWLFVGYDLEDMRQTNWVCRAMWIDPDLDPAARPMGLQGDEEFEEIQIAWNGKYEELKTFFKSRSAPKGAVLARLRPILREMLKLGDKGMQLFAAYRASVLNDAAFSNTMEELQPAVRELYLQSGDIPMPPDDVKDYNQVCDNIFAQVDNMFLPFSDEGRGKWDQPQRDGLIAMAIRHYQKEKERLRFEEEKLH
jgi:hypothetical protein